MKSLQLKNHLLYTKRASLLSLTCALIFNISIAKDARSDGFQVNVQNDSRNEQFDRNVDKVALSAQNTAISKIQKLLKKNTHKKREVLLLDRLAKIQHQKASVLFRISHGKSSKAAQARNRKKYKSALKDTIGTFSRLLRKYPNYKGAGRAHFLRAKAYDELGNKKYAKRDFKKVIKSFPDVPEIVLAYMTLAQYSIDDNQHKVALGYLKSVEELPDDPHYPFALYKSAWSYYNLDNIPTALSYLERHIKYYENYEKSADGIPSSEQAIRETSLSDVPTFYMEGYEKGFSQYKPSKALSYFKDLEDGPHLGKMIKKFAKLLRSHNHSKELIAWKNEIVDEESKRPESLEVVRITFEYLFNQRKFDEVLKTSEDFVKLHQISMKREVRSKEEILAFEEAQDFMLKTAEQLRKSVLANLKSDRVKELSKTLKGLYGSFIKTVKPTDLRIPGAHYNLAETLFKTKEYEESTSHYRWIVDHWKKDFKIKKTKIRISKVSLKAISSRYEHLNVKKWIPKDIQVKKLADDSSSSLPEKLSQWLTWLDVHQKSFPKSGKTKVFDNFVFEANRALYHNRKIKDALVKLEAFATTKKKSKFAIPSATLVLDTYVVSKDWKLANTTSQKFVALKLGRKNKEFWKKIKEVAADSTYKLIEIAYKDGKKEDALKNAEIYIKKYAQKNKRLEDILFLAGKVAKEVNQEEKSEKFFSELIKKFPNSENTASAFLARATQKESRYEFLAASNDYRRYLQIHSKSAKKKESTIAKLRKTILRLEWLSGDYAIVNKTLKNKNFCTESLYEECDQYSALINLDKASHPAAKKWGRKGWDKIKFKDKNQLFKWSMKAPKENRPIWAAAALEHQNDMRFPDRVLLIKILVGRWNSLNELAKLSVVPKISKSIPLAFEQNRARVNKFAKVKANERSIKRRITLIKEMEQAATKVMKLPWARVRAHVMHEVSQLYLDLAHSLMNLKAPAQMQGKELQAYQQMVQKLAFPFEEKGHDIARTAFEIASQFSIEEQALRKITKSFFENNPSQAKSLKTAVDTKEAPALDLALLEELSPETAWKKSIKERPSFYKDKKAYLVWKWNEALENRSWIQAAYFLQEAKHLKAWSESELNLARVVTLNNAGARAEALATLEGVRGDLKKENRYRLTYVLIGNYVHSYGKKKVKRLVEDLEEESSGERILKSLKSEEEAFVVGLGAIWSEADITKRNKENLLDEATDSRQKSARNWAKSALKALKNPRDIAGQNSPNVKDPS